MTCFDGAVLLYVVLYLVLPCFYCCASIPAGLDARLRRKSRAGTGSGYPQAVLGFKRRLSDIAIVGVRFVEWWPER